MATSNGSWFLVQGSGSRPTNVEPGTWTSLSPERAAATAGGLGVRVVEDESLADEIRVVVQHGTVQEQQAFPVDEDLRAFRTLEDLVAGPRCPLPRERVAQARAAAALHADAQPALVDALFGHQRANLASGGVRNLNHEFQDCRISELQNSGLFNPAMLQSCHSAIQPLRSRLRMGIGALLGRRPL